VLNSAKLIQTLLADELVDDLRLMILPVVLGGGLRLLPDGTESTWDLVSTATLPDGGVGLHYRRP